MVLTCPICGNDTVANAKYEKQRCKFCKTNLLLVKRQKGKKSNKFVFSLECEKLS